MDLARPEPTEAEMQELHYCLRFVGFAIFGVGSIALTQAPPVQTRSIERLSASSLLLKIASAGQDMGTATGFVVQKGNTYYLITNRHVVTARRPDNDASLDPLSRVPDQVQILQNTKGKLGQWHWVSEDLLESATHAPRWIEHPTLGKRVDVVFLPLTKTEGIDFYPIDLNSRNTPIRLLPAGTLSIVGFPFGHSSFSGLAIWKSGTIASDPDIDYDNAPQFLIDVTGRPGMSGSPVYARRVGGYLDEQGNYQMIPGVVDRFVGVYAGGIDQFSEVGRIWKVSTVMDIYGSLK